MGLFSPDILQQQQAAESATINAPGISVAGINQTYVEYWNRNSLNPTGGYDVYQHTTVGAGSITIIPNQAAMTTATSANDSNDLFLDEYQLQRTPNFSDATQLRLRMRIRRAGTISLATGFFGLIEARGTITAIPTTAVHMGVYFDDAENANWNLSSANGTSQSKTDTGEAADATFVTLEIRWTGNDNAVLTLSSSGETFISSQTVTDLNIMPAAEFHLFVKTATTAARTIHNAGWIGEWT